MVNKKIAAFDPVKFGQAVRERRGRVSPEIACAELDTVLRILREVEGGNIESVEIFAKFCKWLGTSADAWLGTSADAGAAIINNYRIELIEMAVLRISAEIIKRRMWGLGTAADRAIYENGLTKAAEIIAEEEGIMEKLKRLFDEVLPVTIGNIIHVKRTAGKD